MLPTLRAGAARIEITPPPGLDLTGYIARDNPATGVRDPLYARALALDDGRRQVALVSCDLLAFDADFVDDVRAHIAIATRIPGPQVMLAATHSHAGPAILDLQDCGRPDPAWVKSCQTRIVQAVAQAQAALEPAALAVGQGESTAGVHNRRQPGDVIDPAVGVLRVDKAGGAPLAVVVNYTCHPTCLSSDNRLVSADYPGLVTATVEQATGAICLFLTGAIGDVGPVTRGEKSLATVGQAVAEEALRVLPSLTPIENPLLDTEGEILALPLDALPDRSALLRQREEYRLASLAADQARQPLQARIARAMVGWTERILDRYKVGPLPAALLGEVQVFHLGEAALAGVPGELFVELGLQIKREVAPRPVFIVGCANASVGYLPARRAYPLGGYEIDEAYKYYGAPAVFAPEAGEQLVASVLSHISKQG
ncbi:MAG TPA: neutral/alkaline non-lysosomal ceramidase N-terminal domain-containing protein [Caldilineaceae bacterium]|nr:neutral/alkaline non-lysosomal ceramidase N-terminal domain-containing protein [Caldilineaceae bacterium]